MSTAVQPTAGAETVPATPILNPSNPGKAAQPVDPPGNPPQVEPPTKNEEAPVIPPTAAPKAEQVYDLTLPEGSVADPALVERTVAIARARGLSNDQAQAALDLAVQEIASTQDAVLKAHAPGGAAWTKMRDEWQQAAKNDPSLGATPDERIATVQRGKNVIELYAKSNPSDADAMRGFLNDSGLGDHPAAVRFFAWLGKATSEGSLVMPRAQDGAGKKSDTELFYLDASKAE